VKDFKAIHREEEQHQFGFFLPWRWGQHWSAGRRMVLTQPSIAEEEEE
jgi:hypothetical protein